MDPLWLPREMLSLVVFIAINIGTGAGQGEQLDARRAQCATLGLLATPKLKVPETSSLGNCIVNEIPPFVTFSVAINVTFSPGERDDTSWGLLGPSVAYKE
jgi:hypothetical protein